MEQHSSSYFLSCGRVLQSATAMTGTWQGVVLNNDGEAVRGCGARSPQAQWLQPDYRLIQRLEMLIGMRPYSLEKNTGICYP